VNNLNLSINCQSLDQLYKQDLLFL